MYSSIHRNVIRAVRVLPEAVRIGTVEVELSDNESSQPRKEGRKEVHKQESELDSARGKINNLESQIRLLTNRLEEAAKNYDKLSARCEEVEQRSASREGELQAEMQSKLESERAAVVNEAKKQAASIIKEADEIRAGASEKGLSEGRAKGEQEGLEKARADMEEEYSSRFSGLVSIFEKIHSDIESNMGELIQLNEARLLRLWKETLSSMLNREVLLTADTARVVLEGILERVSDKNRVLIYLSPLDIENIRSQTDKMTESLRGVKHLEFIPDSRVDSGSCIVETNLGIYDARWRVQMEQIETQIADLYREIAKETVAAPAAEPVKKTRGRRKKAETEGEAPAE